MSNKLIFIVIVIVIVASHIVTVTDASYNIYHEMRTIRIRFKYAFRLTRSKTDTLANDLFSGTDDDFRGNVGKMNSGNAIQSNTIDGYSGEADIADFWKNHFSKLLNATGCDTTLKTSLMGKFDAILYSNEMMILNNLILEAIKKLECGKSAGPDGVHVEAIKYAHPIMHVFLLFCFNIMLYTWLYACRYDLNYNCTYH